MNTLYFCAGMGAGSFLTVIASIWLVSRVNKQNAAKIEKQNRDSLQALLDRNDLDREANSLRRIANDYLSDIARKK